MPCWRSPRPCAPSCSPTACSWSVSTSSATSSWRSTCSAPEGWAAARPSTRPSSATRSSTHWSTRSSCASSIAVHCPTGVLPRCESSARTSGSQWHHHRRRGTTTRRSCVSEHPALGRWIDKLEIREIIERSVRHIDDQDGAAFAELFEEDGVLQLAGTVFAGRDALRAMLGGATPARKWTAPGELLKQPGVMHLTTNPIVDVDGDGATAETDMITFRRGPDGRAKIALLARYRDRLRR